VCGWYIQHKYYKYKYDLKIKSKVIFTQIDKISGIYKTLK
jgi:hypothetical protein